MRLQSTIAETAIVNRDEFPGLHPEAVGSSKTLPTFSADRQTVWKRQLGKGEYRKRTFLYRERTPVAREANDSACEVVNGWPTVKAAVP